MKIKMPEKKKIIPICILGVAALAMIFSLGVVMVRNAPYSPLVGSEVPSRPRPTPTPIPYGFATNQWTSSLSVFDTTEMIEVENISLPATPFDIALNPSGTKAYINTTNTGNGIIVFDTENNSVSGTIDISGSVSNDIIFHPNGDLAYSIKNSYYLVVIDAQNDSVLNYIAVNTGISDLAFNSDGSHLYVLRGVPNSSIYVMDTTNNYNIIETYQGPRLFQILINADEDRLYGVNSENHTVIAMELPSGAILHTTNLGHVANRMALHPNGTWVYVSNLGRISLIDPSGGGFIAEIPVYGGADRIFINSSGTRGYVTQGLDGSLAVFDATTNTYIETIDLGVGLRGVAVQ